MVQSMTGHGRAEGAAEGRILSVELRSVNHRHLSIVVRLPRFLSVLEDAVKKRVREAFSRGRIDVFIAVDGTSDSSGRFRLDPEAAQAYYQMLKALKRLLQLPGEIDLSLFGHVREIITTTETEVSVDAVTPVLEKVLTTAVQALKAMQQREGAALAADLTGHLQTMKQHLAVVEGREKAVVRAYQNRLRMRVAELSEGLEIDPARLAQEVAILAERSDITEERTRLRAHLAQFETMLNGTGGVGRGLEFLLQEMHREVNTLSAKSNDLTISMEVVAMKSALEKMREQVLNIA